MAAAAAPWAGAARVWPCCRRGRVRRDQHDVTSRPGAVTRVTTATSAHGCGCARTDVPRTCQTGWMSLPFSNGEEFERSVWSAACTPCGCMPPTCLRSSATRWTGSGGTSSIFAGAGFHVARVHPLLGVIFVARRARDRTGTALPSHGTWAADGAPQAARRLAARETPTVPRYTAAAR